MGGLTFVDVSRGIIEFLEAEGGYSIESSTSRRRIPVADAIVADDTAAVDLALAQAHVIATSVGAAALESVAGPIAAGLRSGSVRPVNVLACENVHPNSSALGAHVARDLEMAMLGDVAFPDCVVDRIAPGDPGAATVRVEAGFEFVVDATAWLGPPPDPSPIVFTSRLDDYKLRKLWMVNGLHALVAWLAVAAGHEFVHEAVDDPGITKHLESASKAMAVALEARCDEFDAAALEEYRTRTLGRFANHELPDLAVRVSRNPLVKLGPSDRIVPAAVAAEALGCDVSGFAAGIAAALSLGESGVDGVDELDEAVQELGVEPFLTERGIRAAGPLYRGIVGRL